MTKETVEAAVDAARSFLRAVVLLRDDTAARNRDAEFQYDICTGTAASGSVRHQSMILTRALAEMRKP